MPEHYFESNPASDHDIRSVPVNYRGVAYNFLTDAGVFSRDGLDEGSRLMLDSVMDRLFGRVLDLGCGWGPVGTIVSRLKPETRVVMTDINERAVELAAKNVRANRGQAQVVSGDGFEKVEGLFDWILFNPPIRAGKQVVYQLFQDAGQFLAPGGQLAVVIRKQQGALSARDYLKTLFEQVDLLERKKGYHVFCCGGRTE